MQHHSLGKLVVRSVLCTAVPKYKLIADSISIFGSFVAKPVDNLALKVFQRYYAELSRALSGCVDKVAVELYSAGLITTQEKSQAVGTQGLTPFRKADCLMEAVERRIDAENSAAPLNEFYTNCSRDAMV